jgi:hypothetical protein
MVIAFAQKSLITVGAPGRRAGGPPGTPLRLLPSPLRPGGGAALRTPSPVRLSAASFFATPGGAAAGTPISESLASTAWLRDLAARTPEQARARPPPPRAHPALSRLTLSLVLSCCPAPLPLPAPGWPRCRALKCAQPT